MSNYFDLPVGTKIKRAGHSWILEKVSNQWAVVVEPLDNRGVQKGEKIRIFATWNKGWIIVGNPEKSYEENDLKWV